MRRGQSAFHVKHKLHNVGGVIRIVCFYGHRFDMLAGRFTSLDLNFDLAGLTRPKDFRKVHSRASSAWRDRLDVEDALPAVSDCDRPYQSLVLRLLPKV